MREMIMVRQAVLDDSPAIARLMGQLGYPTTPETMRVRLESLLATPVCIGFVACVHEEPVGFVGGSTTLFFEQDGLHARMEVLVVDEAWRGHGVGGRLVGALEAWAGQQGAVSVTLTSGYHCHAAHEFYRRRQYRDTGLRFTKRLE